MVILLHAICTERRDSENFQALYMGHDISDTEPDIGPATCTILTPECVSIPLDHREESSAQEHSTIIRLKQHKQ